MREETWNASQNDIIWSVLSIMFVYSYFWFHIDSFFLATVGILIILLSFPITAIICQSVLQIHYFGMLSGSIIFIILGIAADNIFVFYDAWRQSSKLPYEIFVNSEKRRLAYSFRRAVRAIAVTSSTTSVSFMANIFSPLMPIVQFGVFAGIIIIVNYFLVILLFPPATIIYERSFKSFSLRQCFGKKPLAAEKEMKEVDCKVETFFETKWNDNVYKYRWPIIIGTLSWTVFAVIKASEIGPMQEIQNFVSDDNPIFRAKFALFNDFT